MMDYETKEKALARLNELTKEFLAMPTPTEFDRLEIKEQKIALAKIVPLNAKIRELTEYIKEKWGENK